MEYVGYDKLKQRGISHVCLRVYDVERTAKFYQDVFGATIVCEWGKEEKEGISCLALTYELDAEGRAAAKRVWLQEDTLEPVCAEWFLEGDRILHAVFHNGEKDGQTEGAGA